MWIIFPGEIDVGRVLRSQQASSNEYAFDVAFDEKVWSWWNDTYCLIIGIATMRV